MRLTTSKAGCLPTTPAPSDAGLPIALRSSSRSARTTSPTRAPPAIATTSCSPTDGSCAAVTELGDVDRGGVEAARAMELADDLQVSEQQWVSRVIAASHQLVVGDLARAEQLATEALALGSVCEPLVALDYVSLFMWTLRLLQGRLDEIASLVEETAATPGVDVPRRMGLALTRAELGRLDESRAMLDALTARDIDALPKDASWYIALAAMAETAAATNHTKIAGLVFETAEAICGPDRHHVGELLGTRGSPHRHRRVGSWPP